MSGAVKRRRPPPAADQTGQSKSDQPGQTEPAAGRRRRVLSETTIQQLVLRVAVLLAAAGVYFFTRQAKVLELATTSDTIGKRSQPVDCDPKYTAEIVKFPGCSPTRCGRLISDRVVTPHEAQVLRNIATRAFALTGGSGGGASILDLHSGALSKGSAFVNVYRLPQAASLVSQDDLRLYTSVKRRLIQLIAAHFGVEPAALHLAKPTFFSRITAAPAKTVHDQYWHTHVDKETYPSFHYTSLVYLNDYGSEFHGGRFIFNDKDANRTIEPKAGRVSAFTAGWENPHQVEPVTDGVRFALTVAFTCDSTQAIGDPAHVAGGHSETQPR